MKKLTLSVLAALGFAAANAETYYLVGQDGGGKTSFFTSSNPGDNIGWSLSRGGTVLNHTVAAGNDYMVPSGAALRTAQDDNADAFLGDTLKLAGEIWFKKAGNTASPVKVLSIPKLIADGGTLNNEKNDINAFELAGALEIPEGKSLTILNQGNDANDKQRNLKVSGTVTGAGTVYVSLGGNDQYGAYSVLNFGGDWSGFTGTIAAKAGASEYSSYLVKITGPFGGKIESMPVRKNNPSYVFNQGVNNKYGIRISATDGLPSCMRYRTCFYNFDVNAKNRALFTVPKALWDKKGGATHFTGLYYADSESNATTLLRAGDPDSSKKLDNTKLFGRENGDGTVTVYWNYTEPITPTISGTITMDDWTEGETPSEPSGLMVTPAAAQGSLRYKYYKDSDCKQALSEKPTLAGTYYVRGEVAEGDDGDETFWKSAVSEPKEFTIRQQAGGKTRVEIPVGKELSYTGDEQVGVDAGEHYTRDGVYAATAVNSYEAVVTLEDTDNYEWTDLTTAPKTIAWSIKKAENTWTRRASITKKFWKSTEEPGVITPPEAVFGEPKAQISKNGGAFEDWDDGMPTEKGRYEVRWTVADTDSYSALEDSVKFLVDYRYEPTAPFMYTSDNGQTWKGATTIDDACKQINGSGIVEVCEDVSVSALTGNLGYKTVTLRSNVDEVETYAITLTQSADFTIQNGGLLILTNIVFNLSPSANVMRLFSLGANNTATANLEIQAGTVISGKTVSSLIGYNHNHGTVTVTGGTFKDFTCGGTILSASAEGGFTIRGLAIENCTANELIGVGNKTNSLANVTITNNVTSAGAITVGATGVIKVSGDVIVRDNKVGGDEKNIVLQNAANLQMVGDLGAGASVGVSYGRTGGQFGVYVDGDPKTAAKFFYDAKPALMGKVRNDMLFWTGAGLMLLIK